MSGTVISAIPTIIITGFLGAGKSSTILQLLKVKPEGERWAILVNEFGEIGIDGSLLQGHQAKDQGVFIREVPGGCMCCTAGLPMQVALNQLLKTANPDRLLIEPTGLGHPKEVLQTLTKDDYREVIDLQKVLTLVDARKLSDTRYTGHPTFNQQIAIADIVVGNKQDLYQEGDFAQLETYVKEHGSANAQIVLAQQGDITSIDLMDRASAITPQDNHRHHQYKETKSPPPDLPLPASGYIKAVNQGEGFHSIGWRFSPKQYFSHGLLYSFLNTINAERMKAVFITDQGAFGYNLTPDALVENELNHCADSRIEIIAPSIDPCWEARLMACIITNE